MVVEYSEFEIQAVAYIKMRERWGDLVRGEFHKNGLNNTKGRFDIALFNEFQVIKIIIECKRSSGRLRKQQKDLYQSLCPSAKIIPIMSMMEAENVVSTVEKFLKT